MIQMLGLRGSTSKDRGRGGDASPSSSAAAGGTVTLRSPFAAAARAAAGGRWCTATSAVGSGWTRRPWPRCSSSRHPSGSSPSAAARAKRRASSLTRYDVMVL